MLIRKFDYFSPVITLYYKGEKRHSSIFSGIISIIFSIFLITVCIYISIDFLFKKNPSSFYFKREMKNIEIFNLTHDYFFHYITFLDDETKKNDFDEKAFSLIGINNESFVNFFTYNSIYDFSHWKYEKCENLKKINKTIKELIINEKYFNSSLCLSKYYDKKTNKILNCDDKNFPFPNLENNLYHDEYLLNYGILFKECENFSLYNNDSCYDLDTIHKISFSKQRKYIFNYFSNFYDFENFENPIIKQLNKINFNYNPYYIKINQINLLQTIVRTTHGIFFDNFNELKTYNLDNYYDSYLYNYLNLIAELIEIKMTNKMEIYRREYKKFQDIIGSIDGMIEILILLLEIINQFLYHDFRLVYDFNEVIGKKINKIKQKSDMISLSPNQNINSKFYLNNNFITENKLSKFQVGVNNNGLIKTSSLNVNNIFNNNKLTSNSFQNNNKNIITNSFNNFDFNILSNFEDFSWIIYMKSNLCCFKKKEVKYYNKILLLRKNILSEERILKNYWKIKKINQSVFDIKIMSENPSISTYK